MEEPLLISDDRGQLSSQRPNTPSSSMLRNLYIGHFLARWGARMWDFSVSIFMISIWPDSLLLVAIYGAMESASTALFGPIIGQYMDRMKYTKVLKLWLLVQNVSYAIAGCTVLSLLIYPDLKSYNFTAFILLVILTNICGAFGALSSLAGIVLIEREWVVVISEGYSQDVLTNMNSIIRRIDLISKLFAPVITGFIISFVSLKASAIALAIWNITSVLLEYFLLISVYNGIPALAERSESKISRLTSTITERSNLSSRERQNSLCRDDKDSSSRETSWITEVKAWISDLSFIAAWKVYLHQEVVLAGVALAFLFFTVLSFGTLMTATLEWKGIPTFIIGVGRGISAMIGIAATISYPMLLSRTSTLRAGIWSIWSQWTCLLLCVASIWVSNSTFSAYMLMAGVATSRLGLWMFDLAVIQQMQDRVLESDRCVVGGAQNALQSVMDLMSYVMAIFVSNPQDFWELILISFMMVTTAAFLYTFYLFQIRKHIFHSEKLISMCKWKPRSEPKRHGSVRFGSTINFWF